MTFVVTNRMECLFQRCHKEAALHSVCRSVLPVSCVLLVLCVSMYPALWSIGVQLRSAFTGSYIPGHHSVLLVNSPTEQAARDIGRYYWKGEIQDASEILMLVKTKTSRIQQVIEYVRIKVKCADRHESLQKIAVFEMRTSEVEESSERRVAPSARSVHPYANPEVLSFPVEDGNLAYMKWMDEAIPDD
ncbi:protein CutA homolog isoform X2 [Acanthopagrus latus]|uniref:protein CutA homolog isoform X2 n=1 Tax=Acanthopagrus latus TaxID=8177 RepID=UPI00187C38DB|nr:protein CutA homolog isoform X2 [Acanthopagrus latus]